MNQLGIFAKYWQPGQVKTRLARTIGQQPASRLHRLSLQVMLQRYRHLADRRILACWPADRLKAFADLAGSHWTVQPQSPGDLGQRMSHYFQQGFEQGATRIVLLGSDSPTLPDRYVRQALALLHEHPVVLGPAPDGGYYLVGAAGQVPPIFEGVDWSTPRVWRQTTELLSSAGLSYTALPPWYDVDEADDLIRLNAELAQLVQQDGLWTELHELVSSLASGFPSGRPANTMADTRVQGTAHD